MENKMLLVGFGREIITPKESVPLAGFGNTSSRFYEYELDDIMSTCIAFKEGDQTFLVYTNDLIGSDRVWAGEIISEISLKTNVPEENIYFSGTHTHSAPDLYSIEPVIEEYKVFLKAKMVKAAQEAVSDLAPAKLFGTKTETEGLNFVRHYEMADGTIAGDNFGNLKQGYVGYAGTADPEMIIVKIEREGKKDILMVNWQAHPKITGTGGQKYLSADYIFPLRVNFESDQEMLFAFFLGAAGNLNPTSYIPEFKTAYNYMQYGTRLKRFIDEALPNLKEIDGEGIKTVKTTLTQKYNKEKTELLEVAKKVREHWLSSGDLQEGNRYAKENSMASVYEACSIIRRSEYPESIDVTYHAARVGGLSFVFQPYEVFAETGKEVKKKSPFEFTFFVSCATHSLSYIPTERAYDFNCYEKHQTKFERGFDKRIEEISLKLLEELV